MQRSEKAKLTTNIFAGDLNSFAFRNKYNTNEFPVNGLLLLYTKNVLNE